MCLSFDISNKGGVIQKIIMPKFARDILKAVEMDEEFKEIVEKYAEKEPTPMEMDLKVRMDRVIYVLNRTLATIKVMMYLPAFLENDAEILQKYLENDDLYLILRLANKYEASFDVNRYRTLRSSEKIDVLENININKMPNKYSKYTTDQDGISNPHVSQMINILFDNKCIRQLVMNPENLTLDRSIADFLNTMEELKKVAKDMIYETGEEEDAKNKELRQAYKHNLLVVASIKELEARLEKQNKDLGDQLNKKVTTFTMYNQKMDKIKKDFQFQVDFNLAASEKDMMNRTVVSEERQTYLAEEMKRITKEYELLLEEHLGLEKLSRSKRFKAETQLQNWIIKYDQDIGERQTEYETFKARYDEEKAQMEELQDLFDDQEDEYTFLMKEKAEEEERLYNEMAFRLLQSRSARIIQKAWRAYILRKKAKKKGKKGKGKGGKASKGKGKGKNKDLESAMARKPTEKKIQARRNEDLNAALEQNKKFKGDIFDDIQDPNAFDKKDIEVNL